MSIYPERHRDTGRFTGVWIVETTCGGGHKRRARADSFAEAEALEAKLMGNPEPEAKPEVYCMRDLDREAEGKGWRDQKDALRSSRRWKKMLVMIGPKTPVASVRKPQLEDIVTKLRDKQFDNKTINRYLAGVSAMLRWAWESDKIAGMPPVPWQTESKGRRAWLPERLTDAFIAHVEEHAGAAYAFAVEALLLTGMRWSELENLEPSEVEDDVVHLSRTKTSRPRSIPVPEGFGDSLRAFLSLQPPSYRRLLDACTEASEALQIEPKVTPHVLRHTVATRLTSAGVPSLTVAKILGHESIATTKGYAHHEVQTLRAAMSTMTRGNRGAMRLAGLGKTQQNQWKSPDDTICSPLRSHSATRPLSNETNGLPESAQSRK